MKPTYFTCTLGQAATLGLTNKDFKNINQFVTSQAENIPDQPAVAFADLNPASKTCTGSSVWTFSEVHQTTEKVAALLQHRDGEALARSKTVALICSSTPEFLFTWLALMRLGHAVLLIAPQCQPAAIAHLCKTCETTLILYDDVYRSQSLDATQVAEKEGLRLSAAPLPFTDEQPLSTVVTNRFEKVADVPDVHETDVAYLHHTSGTSSGVPKPIPQTHRAGVGVLPMFPDGASKATFTTTPLYHGGVADLFRAWTSGALIWLFPGKGAPITAANVVKCLNAAAKGTHEDGLPPVKYFSSVPYVLQMVEADKQGLEHLLNMDIVGVGGAALPAEVGDRMVEKGIHLISRFGSAECGFLMSSHRDYGSDKEWQYLRCNESADLVKFEEQDGRLAELIVQPGWPHMAKTNRGDGSFASADLFAPHESIPNAWRYDSRADSQLTLITGKKFDPAPMEGSIATSDLLDDVLIFGNGQPFAGALLFRSQAAKRIPDADLVDKLWPTVEKMNADSQDHARLLRSMLVPMPVLDLPLEKSSKGTIIRGAVENRFAGAINGAYTNMTSVSVGDVPDDQVADVIRDMIESIVAKKEKLKKDTDLFSYGVDSVAGMQMRYKLRQLLPQSSNELPLNVVEDCGTVARLADYVIRQRHGEELTQEEDEHDLMLRLVDQYSNFDQRVAQPLANGHVDSGHAQTANKQNEEAKDVIVLTGATGALGAHILALYRDIDTVSKVYCLVRGADIQASKERVNKSLIQRGLPGLTDDGNKVEILLASLGEKHLGLSQQDYDRISQEVNIVMHVAWSVNFRMRLRSFVQENISSVTNLINLALSSSRLEPAKFAYCSSVASVQACSKTPIAEEIIDDPAASAVLGYSRSKWVAEQICSKAGSRTPLGGRVAVFRVGQLSGDSQRGIWNANEAWPMMLSSVKLTRTLPALKTEALDWLPVDIAALALVQGIDGVGGSGETVDVLHVLNENRVPKWAELMEWLRRRVAFEEASPREWVSRMEDAHNNGGADHPAFKLLGLWKRAYSRDDGQIDDSQKDRAGEVVFALSRTKAAIPVLRDVKPLDEAYFIKVWQWIEENM
ncbi:hypothetical protein MBLNU459_g0193t1 [Dothideomycetes sp. NU459]